MRVLLIADAPWVLSDVAAALSDTRYEISTISDPRMAVTAARELAPDAVVVDLQVGSMGGMAVTRALRASYAVSGDDAPPVVLLVDRDADAFLAGRSGAAAAVRKPFSAADLRTALAHGVPAT